MQLDYRLPSEKCRSLIVRYEQVQANGDWLAVVDKHVSSGLAYLVFNSSGRAVIHETPETTLPSFFMVVPLFRSVDIGVYDNLDSFIVGFKASMLSRLLSMNLESVQEEYYRRITNDIIGVLAQRIKEATILDERCALLEDFFISELRFGRYRPDDIDQLYTAIIEGNGLQPISDLVAKFDKSPRTFRRKFVERVGVNAKTLARIVRVNYLWTLILKDNATDFQSMVFEGDYFDQAHLIHDFKQIIGETPSFFFHRNLDNVRFISGKM